MAWYTPCTILFLQKTLFSHKHVLYNIMTKIKKICYDNAKGIISLGKQLKHSTLFEIILTYMYTCFSLSSSLKLYI